MRLRAMMAFGLLLVLAACGADSKWAPDAAVARAAYRADAPPSISLITVVNNRSGEGGHSALLINASQRVIFDPAGTWWHPTVPERHDVLYGITPTMLKFYYDYHARKTYRVVVQTRIVSPEVAELALRRVEKNGAVPKLFCANSVSHVLKDIPGFEGIRPSFFPVSVERQFAKLTGVTTRVIYDNSPDNNKKLLAAQQAAALSAHN